MMVNCEIGRALNRLVSTKQMRKRATAAAPVGRQDFLIPRAGNQLLRSALIWLLFGFASPLGFMGNMRPTRVSQALEEGIAYLSSEHERLAVKVEVARLWLLFLPTSLAVAFQVLTAAHGTLWQIGMFDWIENRYALLIFNRTLLVFIVGALSIWIPEERTIRGGLRSNYNLLHSEGPGGV
jgi:hypothetical protein